MMSDVICEAEWDLRHYLEAPVIYKAVATELETVLTVMDTLTRYFSYPPCPTDLEYEEKLDALCESLRRLDLSKIRAATNELMVHAGGLGPAVKRQSFKARHLRQGALVLARLVDEIRRYQQEPPFDEGYASLTKEIEVVVMVVTALQQYLAALSQPLPKASEHSEAVKMLGESLRGLDVGGCESAMRDMYDYFALAPRGCP